MTEQTHEHAHDAQHAGHAHHAGGNGGAETAPDMATEILRQEFWDARYAVEGLTWSGEPNPQLVAEVGDLTPGRALDVGCGEGGDAVWLARQGWQVTGVDLSPLALAKAAAAAEGAGVADRVRWEHLDVVQAAPEVAAYDLVSVHFLHLPPGPRATAIAGLAAAVAPGGTLLWVAHHPLDLDIPGHGERPAELMPTPEEVAAELDPAVWEVLVLDTRPRTRRDADGVDVLHHDLVVRARRRG